MIGRVGIWVAKALGVIGGLIAAYLIAALIGGAIPANRGWTQAQQGVHIYVIDNGIHTDLVLPAVAEGVDWRAVARAEHVAQPDQAAQPYVAFGWGDRDFYLNTPSWSQVSPVRVGAAFLGLGSTVLHIVHVPKPGTGPKVRELILSPVEYQRLVAYIRGTFAEGASVPGYGGNDAFYPAKGGYSAITTCNQWTGNGLRAAGVRVGMWTPFPVSVMSWL